MISPASPPEGDDLSSPEDFGSRKRRRLRLVGGVLLLALVVCGWFGARPAGRAIKGWQVRRIAAQGEILLDAEAWREAQQKVQDALQLQRGEPAAQRLAARFLTQVGHGKDAADFWRQLETSRPLTAGEQRDFAIAELTLGDLSAAEARLRRAWPPRSEGVPADWRVGMQIFARKRLNAETFDLARKLAASPASTPRQRLDGASTLLASSAPEDQSAASACLRTLADEGRGPESLDALVNLARQTSSALNAHTAPPIPASQLIARLEAHPLAKAPHRLLALDLRLVETPAQRAEIIQTAIQRFSGGETEDLTTLSGWLYGKGEFEKNLEVVPEAKAVLSRALFLQHLDALGALGRWSEIEDLIKRQRFTLEPMVEQMYLARCSQQQGQLQARDLHWQKALEAAGDNAEKLLSIGAYALRNGALGPAEIALTAAVAATPAARAPYGSLIELFQSERRTAALHDLLVAMAARWPGDDAVQNDAAYTGLLLGEDAAPARDLARELMRRSPGSLPHRVTLALAELRLGHALTALDVFRGIDMTASGAQPRQLAVYAAALWETSAEPEARGIVARIPAGELLPEEQALIEGIK